MIDIVDFTSAGMSVYDTQTQRAANILSIQLGGLEYWPEGGIDLRYFLTEPIEFQDASFQAYLIQKLAEWGVNVASLSTNLEALFSNYMINLSPENTTGGMVAR
jgi:hypothetical protein